MDSNSNIVLKKINHVDPLNDNRHSNQNGYYSKIDESTKNIIKETIPNALRKSVRCRPNFEYIKYKSDSKLTHFDSVLTLSEYNDLVMKVSRCFIKIGLEPGSATAILGFNHVAWFLSELGSIFCGASACGVYTTNSAEMCQFILNDCNCQIILVDTDAQLEKIVEILPQCPTLKAVVQFTGDGVALHKLGPRIGDVALYSWDEMLQLDDADSRATTNAEIEQRIKAARPDDCCLLIYTSGTTGNPKGVELSHDNVLFVAKIGAMQVRLQSYRNSIISYLPLSHIAANTMDLVTSFVLGFTVYFAQPDALKGSLGKTLVEVRPTMFLGVPRVFEKVQEQMQEVGAAGGKLKRVLAAWAKNVGYRNSMLKVAGKPTDSAYCIANMLVFSTIKRRLGLDRCHYMASAAAPLTRATLDYFLSLDMPINQIYGMSECAGPQTIGRPDKMQPGCAGNLLVGTETLLVNMDEHGVGEVCMRGRHVFKGYHGAPDKTEEALDKDNWLHSGDLGRVDRSEFLYITGRIKELIITAGGENVAPVPIEENIKMLLPFVANVMLVGDEMKFISCLLTLKSKIDPDTQMPVDELTPAAIRGLVEHGVEGFTKVSEVFELQTSNQALRAALDKAIKQTNEKSVSRAACVQKWRLLPRDFSIPGGELGPTMKLKRPVITKMYSEDIKCIYQA